MKHFRIIFTILALFFGATACMQQEKEIFESAENQARKTIVANALQEGNKNPNIEGAGANTSGCPAPTQMTYTPLLSGTSLYSWSNVALSYQVTYLINGNVALVTTVNVNYIYLPSPTNNAEIQVRAFCSIGGLSEPLLFTITPGNTGGTAIIMADNLDNFTGTTGTYASHTYTYSSTFAGLVWNTTSSPNLFRAQSLFNSSGSVSPVNVTNLNAISTSPSTYTFKTPNLSSTIKNTLCTNSNAIPYIDIFISVPSIPVGTIVGYRENVTGAPWIAIDYGSLGTSNITLPNLKRNTSYQIKFLSQYTNLPTINAPVLCASGT